jgi:(1->4)-alpha-D-glucan 1-alpha-D-glucosylmutase
MTAPDRSNDGDRPVPHDGDPVNARPGASNPATSGAGAARAGQAATATADAALDAACARAGIAPAYLDPWGREQHASLASKRALLAVLAPDGASPAEPVSPPVLVRRDGEWPWALELDLAEGVLPRGARWSLVLEPAGADDDRALSAPIAGPADRADPAAVAVRRAAPPSSPDDAIAVSVVDAPASSLADEAGARRVQLRLSRRAPWGYHALVAHEPEGARELLRVPLIACPDRCFVPPRLAIDANDASPPPLAASAAVGEPAPAAHPADTSTHAVPGPAGDRYWGLAAQLYALRSDDPGHWGIGNFTTLKALLGTAAQAGAQFVGLNPLHALFAHDASRSSPYSPSSRLWLNPIYLDLTALPEYADCPAAQAHVATPAFQTRLVALREAELVDHVGVDAAQREVLALLFAHFRRTQLDAARSTSPRARAFRAFQQAGGAALRTHALFEALQAHFHAADPGVWGWPAWPAAYRDIGSPEVAAFAEANLDAIEAREYLQWACDEQLAEAAAHARAQGMALGLYCDLAVGVDHGGSETWRRPALHAFSAHVGAPPDEFNSKGQDWGLPPWRPQALRALAYTPFIDTLRACMRHAGALRIDHVMGLMRLYWQTVPDPAHPDATGAYVNYPFEDLLGVLALESHRQRCLVIGEDLGVVPEPVREAMAERAMLSYRPLYFAHDVDGSVLPPAAWPRAALAAVGTHDMATLRAFWDGQDIGVRRATGFIADDAGEAAERAQRERQREAWLEALRRSGVPAAATLSTTHPPRHSGGALGVAVHAFLASTPCALLAVRPEDVLEQLDAVNLPGTSGDAHPNWCRKLPATVEALADDARWQATVQAIVAERPLPRSAATDDTAPHTGAEPRPLAAARADEASAHRAAQTPPPAAGASHDQAVADRLPSRQPLPALGTTPAPRATYRVQMHAGFGFDDARALLPYLQALGVSHLYTSPILKARAGSTHGYDVIDHNVLNPELGDEAAFEALNDALMAHGLRHVLDIVPNHMGVLGTRNPWWQELLTHGAAAEHAKSFDIDWHPADASLAGKVLLPVLGKPYGEALHDGELQVVLDEDAACFEAAYFDHRFPLDPRSWAVLIDEIADDGGAVLPSVRELADALRALPPRDVADASARVHRRHEAQHLQAAFAKELQGHGGQLVERLHTALKRFNGQTAPDGPRASPDRLHGLLEDQAWRLAHWKAAGGAINYRRFFDINDLAAVRMEHPAVFDEAHRTVFAWLAAGLRGEGPLTGLRLDHPDGLHDPAAYFQHLQRRHAELQREARPGQPPEAMYLLVEKILAEHEALPADWPVHGDTGYRFTTLVNGLFVDARRRPAFDAVAADFFGETIDTDAMLEEAKHAVLTHALGGELEALAAMLHRLAAAELRTRDLTLGSLRRAIAAYVVALPIYRTYVSARGVSAADRQAIGWATAAARARLGANDGDALDFLAAVLRTAPDEPDDTRRDALLRFVARLQQFSAPAMAKSMEDTTFYRDVRLVAANEVGGDPRHASVAPAAFHAANAERARRHPLAMLGTSTHDTKRSEDVRARIDVLSELPALWAQSLARFDALNAGHVRRGGERDAPSRADQWLLYQTLVGVWPDARSPDAHEAPSDDEAGSLAGRLKAYTLKAAREAKRDTSWTAPDETYEGALTAFVDALVGPEAEPAFAEALQPLVDVVATFGRINSLSQTLLKLTVPGVPDVYQGCETWNFSLVDPDNRRPVAYGPLRTQLQALQAQADQGVSPEGAAALLPTGAIKLHVVAQALRLRAQQPALFAAGGYEPCATRGPAAAHAVAFVRQHADAAVLVVAPRLLATLCEQDASRLEGGAAWRGSSLVLPPALADRRWRCMLSGTTVTADAHGAVALDAALQALPLALFVGEAA